jgi:putative ribosome biogenesis GTPase RsgA
MGNVGTGKSSLLSALLAELDKESGVIAIADLDKGGKATITISTLRLFPGLGNLMLASHLRRYNVELIF